MEIQSPDNSEYEVEQIKSVDFDENLYKTYHYGRSMPAQMKRQWLKAFVKHAGNPIGQVMFDAGCGTGRFTYLFTKSLPLIHAYGMDSAQRMLEVACRENSLSNIVYMRSSLTEQSLQDKSIDVIWMSMVAHHLHSAEACARMFHNVLKIGGRVLIRNNFKCRLHLPYYTYFPEAKLIDEQRMPSLQDTIRTFESNGFRLQSQEQILQHADDNLKQHYLRIKQRSLSTLHLISDEEYDRGLSKMYEAAKLLKDTQPIFEPIDLLTFLKK